MPQHVYDHAGDGGLAVTAADDHTGLALGALVEVRGVTVHRYTQFLCAFQLGVVQSRVHAEDHGRKSGMDAQWIPAQAIGHQPQAIQAAAAGLEDLVVTTRHLQTLLVQSDGQVVHGASADGDEMDLRGHAHVRLCLCGSSGAQSSSQPP